MKKVDISWNMFDFSKKKIEKGKRMCYNVKKGETRCRMKNVILLGDSIRLGAPPHSPGYGVYVKERQF